MRILHLTPELPHAPGGSGGSTRQFQLLRRIREHGHEVEVVAPVHPSQAAGARRLEEGGIRLRGVRRPPSRVRETLRALARRPALAAAAAPEPVLAWQVDVFWTALRALARQAIAERRPDAIVVEHDWAAGWQRHLPGNIPRALTLHNLSWRYYEARAAAAGGARGRLLALEAARFRRHDRRHLNAYDLLIAMSDADRDAVAELSATRCEVVPNGVDTSAPAPPAPDGSPLFLFTGTLSYPPNAEGLLWLLRDVWPVVRRELPEARLRVVGRDPPAEAQRLADAAVEMTGWVEDVAPHFAASTAVLVPIRSGAGTRLKVLDAMAAGRAMVSTSQGHEGVDVEPGVHLLAADEPEEFAQAAVRLARNRALRDRLASAARRRAEEAYDWARLGDRLEALLRGIAR